MQQLGRCYLVALLFFFALKCTCYTKDGSNWIVLPPSEQPALLGSTIYITWQYTCPNNTVLGASKIIHNGTEIAYRYRDYPKYISIKTNAHLTFIGGWNITMQITEISKINSGSYCCHLECENYRENKCTKLITYDPPRVVHQTPNKHLSQNNFLSLTCNSSGDPKPNLFWTRKRSERILANSFLIFLNITGKESEGTYCCHAINKYGNDTDCTVVNVTEYQPINTVLITNTDYIIRNKTFQVLCLADASPRAHFFIYQGEMKLGNFTYINVTITPGNGTTENISCISKNKYGEGKRVYLTIPIYELPALISQPNTTNTITTSNITLKCEATGIPEPTITWLDDNNNILHQKHNGGVNGQFQVSLSGCENIILRYYCKASNIVGSVRSPLLTIQVIRNCSSTEGIVRNEEQEIPRSSFTKTIIIIVVIVSALFILVVVLVVVVILCSRKKKHLKSTVPIPDNSKRRSQVQNQQSEESPYLDPIDAIPVINNRQTRPGGNYESPSNADYATVEETGYKRDSNTNNFTQTKHVGSSEEASRPTNETSNIPVDDSVYASVLNSRSPKTKPKVEPVYAKVNKKKKKKEKATDMPLIPLYEEIPSKSSETASTSSPILTQSGPDQHLHLQVISNPSQDNE